MNTCTECGLGKPLCEFYMNKRRGTPETKCKSCMLRRSKKYRQINSEKVKAHDRERNKSDARREAMSSWSRTESGKMSQRKATKRYHERNPEKRAAHVAVDNAKRRGDLTPLPCDRCGSEKSQAHHHDYSKQLDVIWLCDRHHRMEHAR